MHRLEGVHSYLRPLCAVASALALGCGPQQPYEPAGHVVAAISGGALVESGAWPAVAWLDNGCTGVVVAPDVVVYAAHCGADASTAWFGDELTIDIDEVGGLAPARDGPGVSKVAVASCATFPDWGIASGNDIAYCILAQEIVPTNAIAPMLFGCESQALTAGAVVTLVGFGRDTPTGAPGMKRSVEVSIDSIGVELNIGNSNQGTCAGDSGSPAFLALGDQRQSEWRVAGILSTGLVGDGCGTGFYADAATITPWLEQSTGRDLTPCFNADGSVSRSHCFEPALDRDGLPTGVSLGDHPVCGEGSALESKAASCSVAAPGRSDSHGGELIASALVAAAHVWRRRVLARQRSAPLPRLS